VAKQQNPLFLKLKMKKTCLIDQSEEKDGLVYFIGNDQGGPVKIGFTSHMDPTTRLRQLQTASPYRLNVLGSIPGTVARERAIHAFLMDDRLKGEWFERESALAMLQHLSATNSSWDYKNKFFDKLFDIAVNIGSEDLTAEEIMEGDLEPVVSTIGRHILLDMLNTFRECHAEKPLPFLTWLVEQAGRDDATGDLAKDACRDDSFPSVGSVFDYVNYIVNESGSCANPAATRTIIDAWIECQQVVLSIR
jgi:hypothetical protein